jgi:Tfp pilus assembly PilM family ATPase
MNVENKAAKKGYKTLFLPAQLINKLGFFRGAGKSVIGIQIAGDMLRILEVDKGVDPPRIVNFSASDPLMENVSEAADQILGLMEEKGITGRNVHATVYEHGTELRLVSLPILGKNEMQAVVRRELKKIVPEASAKDIAFDFWYDKSTRKGRKADVLIGMIPRESSKRIMTLMEHADLDTQLITSVPLGLISALGMMGEQFLKKVAAIIHLERDRSYLVIANRGEWMFSREFQSVLIEEKPKEEGKTPLEVNRTFVSARYIADQERLLIEVNRSLLYFKQRFRGEGVSLAVLSGEAFNLEELVESFKDNLGIQAAIFSPLSAFQTDHMGDRASKLGRILPSLALPLGAAMQNLRDAKLNFVPPDYIARHKTRARRFILSAAAVVSLILIITGYVMVRNTRLELERLLAQENQEQVIADLTRKLDDLAEVTAQRQLAVTREEFLSHFSAEQSPVENLLIALSYYVPDNMTLYNLNVDRENDNTTELVGRVRGTGIADSDAIFNNFYNRIKSSGLFSEVAEPLLSSTIENEVYILEFKIDCKLNV